MSDLTPYPDGPRQLAEVIDVNSEYFESMVEIKTKRILERRKRTDDEPIASRASKERSRRLMNRTGLAGIVTVFGSTLAGISGATSLVVSPGVATAGIIGGVALGSFTVLGGAFAADRMEKKDQRSYLARVGQGVDVDRAPKVARVAFIIILDAPTKLLEAGAPTSLVADAEHRTDAAVESLRLLIEIEAAGGKAYTSEVYNQLLRAAAETEVIVEAYQIASRRGRDEYDQIQTDTVNEVFTGDAPPEFPAFGRD